MLQYMPQFLPTKYDVPISHKAVDLRRLMARPVPMLTIKIREQEAIGRPEAYYWNDDTKIQDCTMAVDYCTYPMINKKHQDNKYN